MVLTSPEIVIFSATGFVIMFVVCCKLLARIL
jgi:hypothetical protein